MRVYPRIKIVDPEVRKAESVEIRIKREDLVTDWVSTLPPAATTGRTKAFEVRADGELKNKAAYLNDDYRWEIVQDSSLDLCLVCLKK